MANKNFEAILPPAKAGYRFVLKSEAIKFCWEHGGYPWYIKNRLNEQCTYFLEFSQTKCRVCGNELNGRKSCGWCDSLFIY